MNHSHPQQPSPVPQHMPSSSKPTAGAPKLPHNVCQADVKPRLTKEQHDILETHFKAQPKPTTNTKKGFADTLGVPLDKINVGTLTHGPIECALTKDVELVPKPQGQSQARQEEAFQPNQHEHGLLPATADVRPLVAFRTTRRATPGPPSHTPRLLSRYS
jgi:hypothetical protein